MRMLDFIFMILMIYIFGKLFFFGIKMAWSLSKFVLTVILFPIILIVMALSGLFYLAFILLVVLGLISLFKGEF